MANMKRSKPVRAVKSAARKVGRTVKSAGRAAGRATMSAMNKMTGKRSSTKRSSSSRKR